MPTLTKSQQAAADLALKEGRLQDALNIIAARAGVDAPELAPEAPPAEPPPPREPNEIIYDLLKGIHALLGNSPALTPLMNELAESLVKPEPDGDEPE